MFKLPMVIVYMIIAFNITAFTGDIDDECAGHQFACRQNYCMHAISSCLGTGVHAKRQSCADILTCSVRIPNIA